MDLTSMIDRMPLLTLCCSHCTVDKHHDHYEMINYLMINASSKFVYIEEEELRKTSSWININTIVISLGVSTPLFEIVEDLQ